MTINQCLRLRLLIMSLFLILTHTIVFPDLARDPGKLPPELISSNDIYIYIVLLLIS